MDWQPISTIPRDGKVVELLSPSEGIDTGNWYAFPDGWAKENPWWRPLAGLDDTTGDLTTEKGSGDYTHWREIS